MSGNMTAVGIPHGSVHPATFTHHHEELIVVAGRPQAADCIPTLNRLIAKGDHTPAVGAKAVLSLLSTSSSLDQHHVSRQLEVLTVLVEKLQIQWTLPILLRILETLPDGLLIVFTNTEKGSLNACLREVDAQGRTFAEILTGTPLNSSMRLAIQITMSQHERTPRVQLQFTPMEIPAPALAPAIAREWDRAIPEDTSALSKASAMARQHGLFASSARASKQAAAIPTAKVSKPAAALPLHENDTTTYRRAR